MVRVFSKDIIYMKGKKADYWNYWIYDWKLLASILTRWFRSGKYWWGFSHSNKCPCHRWPSWEPRLGSDFPKDTQHNSSELSTWKYDTLHFSREKGNHLEGFLYDDGFQTLEEVFIRHISFIHHLLLNMVIQNQKTWHLPMRSFSSIGKDKF